MYNFPPPYSNYYKNSIRKPKKINTTKANFKKDSENTTKPTNDTDSSACINILGIKLYVDDLIILFIIFILYKEKVKDNELIICLLLLLLNWVVHNLSKKECTFMF